MHPIGDGIKHLVRNAASIIGITALVALGLPVSATADEVRPPEVAWTGNVINVSPDGSKAYINAKYRCWGGEEGSHLWVSVKQGPDVAEPDQTGSAFADAWYDTNWNFENSPAGLTVDCDGHWHTTRYTLKNVFGSLVDGPAFVQFCLFDSTGSEETGFKFDYSWKQVRVP